MAEVGDRIAVASKGKPRAGVVTVVKGAMITVRWDTGVETSLIPGPGVLSVVTSQRRTQSGHTRPTNSGATAAARKAAPAKKAPAGKKAVAKKAPTGKKAVAKKAPTGKKAVAKKAPTGKKAVAKKAPTGKKAVAKKTSSSRTTGKKTHPAPGTNRKPPWVDSR
jgi:hypothetical protein